MRFILKIFLLFQSTFLFAQVSDECCINPSWINPNAMCGMIWDPVVGCDGEDYSNVCTAKAAGVSSWTNKNGQITNLSWDCIEETKALCISPSGVEIYSTEDWINPYNHCEKGKCSPSGKYISLDNCEEDIKTPCHGEWVKSDDQCCYECVETVLCTSESGIKIYEEGYWENPNDPCDAGECLNNGEFKKIINNEIIHGCTNLKDDIKKFVELKILKWQEKGEFEKTYTYKNRVNEKTRKKKIKEFETIIIDSLKQAYAKTLDFNQITMSKYDADNEVFLFSSPSLGEFAVNVPIDIAPEFKRNKKQLLYYSPEVVIHNNAFILSHLEVCLYVGNRHSYRCYNYDIKNTTEWSEVVIDYNFPDIQIENIDDYKNQGGINKDIVTIELGSEVDKNIPTNPKVNHRYALIIGNEDYSSYQSGLSDEQNVDFAENDAYIFKEYALNTLGVKEENLYYLINATSGQMKQKIKLLSKILNEIGSEAELIFYYAGHGYPNELTKIPYLIPVDISANDLDNAINLSDLLTTFSESKANKITVFLDACFTGGARSQSLVSSRGVKIRPKQENLLGNLVVFSASSETQSALSYYEQSHGMFTYFLLDKLKSSKGYCSYFELSEYLKKNVSLWSLKVNEKEQNPEVNASENIYNFWGDWRFY